MIAAAGQGRGLKTGIGMGDPVEHVGDVGTAETSASHATVSPSGAGAAWRFVDVGVVAGPGVLDERER